MNQISYEQAKQLFTYYHETGILRWNISKGNNKAGSIVGSINGYGYLRVQIDKKTHLVHRIIWLYVHGKMPENDIDHINGIRTDNRIENLRDVTRSVNIQNRRSAISGTKTGLLGVYPDGRKFKARIRVKGKMIHLGMFKTKEEAYSAYVKYKRIFHEGCTI